MFEYERLVQILLHGVSYREQEGFVQRIAIYLLNSLACQVDGRQKMFLGDLGAISVSVDLCIPSEWCLAFQRHMFVYLWCFFFFRS